jgi:Uma2 family endonuclease
MTVETKLITADELLLLPHGYDKRYELVKGELITMSPAGLSHGIIGGRILGSLGSYVEARKLGVVPSSDTGYLLERNPDTVLAPDVSFIAAHRVTNSDQYFAGAPDLAVEVISPSDSVRDVDAKVAKYLSAGTRLVIVVHPRKRTATVTTPTAVTHLTLDDTLTAADVIPGWSLPMRELFR